MAISPLSSSCPKGIFFTTPPPSKNTQERRNQEQQPTFSSSRRREREFLIFFGKRALKFTPEARKPHTRTRNTDNKNVFRSFLLCWHQSRRQDERPRLCFLEKSVGASLRRKKTLVRVLVLKFFFVNHRFSSARAVESSAISLDFTRSVDGIECRGIRRAFSQDRIERLDVASRLFSRD